MPGCPSRCRSASPACPASSSNEIVRWFEGRALDGLNIHLGHPSQFARFTGEVVPILQERGVFRTDYAHDTLRGHFGLPIPTNRRTAPEDATARQPERKAA